MLQYTFKKQEDFCFRLLIRHSVQTTKVLGPELFPPQRERRPEVALYLFLELSQLARQLSHQSDSAVQFLLQRAHLVLLVVSLAAHQRHGSHTGEPLQVLLLGGGGERGRDGMSEGNSEKGERNERLK